MRIILSLAASTALLVMMATLTCPPTKAHHAGAGHKKDANTAHHAPCKPVIADPKMVIAEGPDPFDILKAHRSGPVPELPAKGKGAKPGGKSAPAAPKRTINDDPNYQKFIGADGQPFRGTDPETVDDSCR